VIQALLVNFKLLHRSIPFKLELKKPNFTSVLKKIAVPVVDDMVDDKSANVRLRRVESFRLRASLNGKRISALGLQEIQGPSRTFQGHSSLKSNLFWKESSKLCD
jgi:hypothetical protein